MFVVVETSDMNDRCARTRVWQCLFARTTTATLSTTICQTLTTLNSRLAGEQVEVRTAAHDASLVSLLLLLLGERTAL